MAHAEFGGIPDPRDLLAAVSSWVGTRLAYVPGSSRPTDGAVETLLQRQGVCRDYAHLVIALLRGLDVPARLTAVYAPGLEPMDFHAVAEAAIDGTWYAVDATLLAPRSSLLRICTRTGRRRHRLPLHLRGRGPAPGERGLRLGRRASSPTTTWSAWSRCS